MKKVIILSFLFAIYTSVFAQTNIYHPFPDSNAIWHNYFAEGYGTIDSMTYSLALNGDTVINTHIYSKLYYLNDTAITANALYWGCLREDSTKRVFYIGRDFYGVNFIDEIQLYDFGKNIGDTITYGIWGKRPILSIDSVLVGQHYRKRFGVLWDYFIEGIGSVEQLLSPITDIPTKYYTNWKLICFKQDNEVQYINPDYNTCFYSFGINEKNISIINSINVSPNPFTTSAQITFNQTYQSIAIEVYDIEGKLLQQNRYAGCDHIEIRRGNLADGLYFLKITLDDKAVETRKIIINN